MLWSMPSPPPNPNSAMSDPTDELYQAIILEHAASPRHYGKLPPPALSVEGYNPLCGDQVGVSVTIKEEVFTELNCFGQGCAISKASASVLTTLLRGQPVSRFYEVFGILQGALKGDEAAIKVLSGMGDIAALEGVRKFPARIKCATLAWQALRSALEQRKDGQFTI